MGLLEKYRRIHGQRFFGLPLNPSTGLPYSKDVAPTPRNMWRFIKWLLFDTILFAPIVNPFVLIFKWVKGDRRRRSNLFYDAEFDTWFRHGRDVSHEVRRTPRNCNPPKPKSKYKMTPHKFE